MALFQTGDFTLHSGSKSKWKIMCEALTPEDWAGLAAIAAERLPAFGSVEGVPRGGLAFAEALKQYATTGPLLIADDVMTTGASMEQQRAGRRAIGVVAFARTRFFPLWIHGLFVPGLPLVQAVEG